MNVTMEQACFSTTTSREKSGLLKSDRTLSWLAALTLLLVPFMSANAAGPTIKLRSAAGIDPSTAWSFYSSSTSHTTGTAAWSGRPPEIKKLARALGAGRYNADQYAARVFDYVRLNIEPEFRFGLGKGARGAALDQSGTPFDQANLMVELLREGGVSASYQIGPVVLNATEFGQWTGLVYNLNQADQTFNVDARAACTFLADGGIPASVNGSSSCGSLSGTLSTVTFLHVWVQANGKVYDPSYKRLTLKSGIDLAASMGCGSMTSSTCGSTINSVGSPTQGSVGSAPFVQNINSAAIHGQLSTYAQNLASAIKSADRFASLEEVASGGVIDRSYSPTIATGLPYGSSQAAAYATWSGDIPDRFRTTLNVQFLGLSAGVYLDEVYGKRLRVGTLGPHNTWTRTSALYAESQQLAIATFAADVNTQDIVTLAIDHPYAVSANGSTTLDGTYADETSQFYAGEDHRNGNREYVYSGGGSTGTINAAWPNAITIVAALGRTGSGQQSLMSDLQHIAPGQLAVLGGHGSHRDQHPTVAAGVLAQTSAATRVLESAARSKVLVHHTFGVVYAVYLIDTASGMFNMTSAASVTQANSNTTDRGAAFAAYALMTAALEGSVPQQTEDGWDSLSSVSKLWRANEDHERFFGVTSGNYSSVSSTLSANGYTSTRLANISTLLASGYQIVLPEKGTLPCISMAGGSMCPGDNAEIISNATELGHTISERLKGDASVPQRDPVKSAMEAAKLQESSLRNRDTYQLNAGNGTIVLKPAPDLAVGSGEYPASLMFQRTYSSSNSTRGTCRIYGDTGAIGEYCRRQTDGSYSTTLSHGWRHNFQMSTEWTNNGSEAFGITSGLRASTALASLYVAFDLARNRSMASDLAAVMVARALTDSLMKNAVVVSLPEKTLTFVKLPDGTYDAPVEEPSAQITLSGSRSGPTLMGTAVLYDYSPTTVQYRSSKGDVMNFAYNSMSLLSAGNVYGFAEPTYNVQDWTTPEGIRVKFEYTDLDNFGAGHRARVLTRVSNNLGHSISINPGSDVSRDINFVRDQTGRQVTYSVPFSSCVPATGYPAVTSSYFAEGYYNTEDCRGTLTVTQADDQITRYSYVPDSASPDPAAPLVPTVRLRKWFTPSSATVPFVTFAYDEQMHVRSVVDASGGTTSVFTAAIGGEIDRLGEVQDATGAVSRTYFDRNLNPLVEIDGLGRVTANFYDNARRLRQTIYPEGNGINYQYDVRSNLLSETRFAKPGSGYASITDATYTYSEGSTTQSCSNLATCNKPVSIKDGKDNYTYVSYSPTTGQVLTITGPAFTNGISGNPLTTFCYTGNATNINGSAGPTLYLLTGRIVRESGSVNRVTSYSYNPGHNFDLSTAIVDPSTSLSPGAAGSLTCPTYSKSGALNLTTTFSFDSLGNLQSVDGARTDVSDVTSYSYDRKRRLTRVVSPAVPVQGDATPRSPITRYTYNVDGQPLTTRESLVPAPVDPDPANPWPTLNANEWRTESRTYWPTGDLATVEDNQGHVTQYAYDAVGRNVLVTDPDSRRTGTVYDAAGQSLCVWKGWSSVTAPTSCGWNPTGYTEGTHPLRYAAYTYTSNGESLTTTDANNNTTQFAYDGHDRLRFTLYPDPDNGTVCTGVSGTITTSTAPSCSGRQTYEQYGYDNNDNRTGLRTRKGDVISFTYNPADLVDTKTVPSLPVVNYTYWLSGDAMGVAQGAYSTSYTYDGAGRRATETNNGRQVTYGYDGAGNRRTTLWPDSYQVTYKHDALNRMEDVHEGTTAGPLLAHYDYDILSQRRTLTFGGTSANRATYDYDGRGALNSLSHQMNAEVLSLGYLRNGSRQITKLSVSDNFYLPRPSAASNIGYAVNRLNQYAAVGAITGTEPNGQPRIQGARGKFITIPFDDLPIVIPSVGLGRSPVDSAADPGGSTVVYDLNGNMRRWTGPNGARHAYTYDAENRLRAATTGNHSVSYEYDGLGRRISKTVDGVQTGYLLDGDEEIAEYNVTGGNWGSTAARRYVMGPAIDDRVAMVDGASGVKNYYHINHQGSVVATTDSAGTPVQKLSYDEYGKAGSGSAETGQVFRYTGRRFDYETGLYYYRARYYAPEIGRFLQTDPVGYEDDFNLYAYGYNDPLNGTDPSGTSWLGDFLDALANPFKTMMPTDFESGARALTGGPMAGSSPEHEIFVQSTADVFQASAAATASVGDKYVAASTMVMGEAAAVSRGAAAARSVLPPAAAKIDSGKIREIERLVRSGETAFPLDTAAQLRAVAESLANKVRIQVRAGNMERAAEVRDSGLRAVDTLDRFDPLTPEARRELRDVVSGALPQ